ncbi:hypothetical protein [Sphingomonas japonica]|uniref:Uncharacterized protein n=1 Tax=Sphingomonas japonica TaxID=511662 RepID=A0ABX0U6X7_9SPHN|nr:hypothetical protein [Sphingomonas japonica]NIJ25181.1 hypothetical protein [Sphingomonas japonica]
MRVALAALLLAGCSQIEPSSAPKGPPDLETAAIERGLVIDPATVDLVGLYARAGDRLCITGGAGRYRIGAFVEYGEGQRCTARGTVARSGDTLTIAFGEGCRFDARYDGIRIAFPGRLPAACAQSCEGRASLEGLATERLSDSPSEAAALRDPDDRPLCPSTS